MPFLVVEYWDVCEVIDAGGEVHAVFTDAVDKNRRRDRARGWAASQSGCEPDGVEVVLHGD